MLVNWKNIKIIRNYVLVKPDADYDKYHNEKGEETKLYAPTSFRHAVDPLSEDNFAEADIMDSYSHNFAYSGTVMKLPVRLEFHGYEVRNYLEKNQHNLAQKDSKNEGMDQMKAGAKILAGVEKMRESSLDRISDMDIKEGDKVYFDYLERFRVYEEGRAIETEDGDMFLMKYDKLELRIRDGEIKPLNGNVFVEWSRYKTLDYGSLSLEVPGSGKKIEDTKGIQEAEVIALPEPLKAHMDDLDFDDPVKYLSIGDRVKFNSHRASNLENDNHFTLYNGREILKIQSRDILGVCQN